MMGGISKWIPKVAPVIAFMQQITAKDLAQINANIPPGTQISMVDNAKNIANIVVGRMTGWNPFPDAYQAAFKLNPAGVINPWTGASVAGLIYGELGKHFKILPKAGFIRRTSRNVLPAAIIAGLFDAPTPGGNTGTVAKPNYRAIPTAGTQGITPLQAKYGSQATSTSYTMELGR